MFFVPPTPSTPNLPYQCRFLLYLHCLLILGDPRRDYVCWLTTFLPKDYFGPLFTRWARKEICCYFSGVSSIQYGKQGSTISLMFCTLSFSLHYGLDHVKFFLFSYGAIVAPISIASWGAVVVSSHTNCMPISSSFRASLNLIEVSLCRPYHGGCSIG